MIGHERITRDVEVALADAEKVLKREGVDLHLRKHERLKRNLRHLLWSVARTAHDRGYELGKVEAK